MQKITYLHFLIPEHRNPPQCFFFLQIYHPSTLQLTSSWVAISLFPPTKALAYLPIPNILPAPLGLFSHHLPSASFAAHPSTDMDTALLLSVTQRGGRPSSPPPPLCLIAPPALCPRCCHPLVLIPDPQISTRHFCHLRLRAETDTSASLPFLPIFIFLFVSHLTRPPPDVILFFSLRHVAINQPSKRMSGEVCTFEWECRLSCSRARAVC